MNQQPGELASGPGVERQAALPSVWLALLLWVMAYLLVGVVSVVLEAGFESGFALAKPAAFRWSMLIAQTGCMLAFPAFLLWRLGYSIKASLGLARPRADGVLLALAGGFCFVVTCQSLGEWITHLLPLTFRNFEKYLEELLPKVATPDVGTWLVVMLTVALTPAVSEEALFRGLALGAVRRRWGVVMAVLATSVLFGIAHGTPVAFVTTFLLGVLLAAVTLLTGSIWCAAVLHLANNVLVVEQANRLAPYVITARVEPVMAWSVIPAALGTVVMIAGFVWLWQSARARRSRVAAAVVSILLAAGLSVAAAHATLNEASVWLHRAAVYHATVARPGSRTYDWAHAQDWIRPEQIRAERDRLMAGLAGAKPSEDGAQELAGLIVEQGDLEARQMAWSWFERAGAHDAWQVPLLEALQQTPLGPDARALAWSRVPGDPDVGAELVRAIRERRTSADREDAAKALSKLPMDESYAPLREALQVIAKLQTPATTMRRSASSPTAP
jgi:membrane protease YdiL (CAAX protease family)